MLDTIIAITVGAALGALCRWFLGEIFNSLYPAIPPGTLIANVLGGYVIGLALSFFSSLPEISHLWRLFVITGFLGALTTFSTFTAEVGRLIQCQQYSDAIIEIALHVCGSLLAFFLGIGTFILVKCILEN